MAIAVAAAWPACAQSTSSAGAPATTKTYPSVAAQPQSAPAANPEPNPRPATPTGTAPADKGSTTTSSGSLQTVVITGSKAQGGGGLITPLDVPKSASVISEKYIKDQSAAANPFQLLNMSAGVNSNGRGPMPAGGFSSPLVWSA